MSAFGREFYVIIERDEDGYYVGGGSSTAGLLQPGKNP